MPFDFDDDLKKEEHSFLKIRDSSCIAANKSPSNDSLVQTQRGCAAQFNPIS